MTTSCQVADVLLVAIILFLLPLGAISAKLHFGVVTAAVACCALLHLYTVTRTRSFFVNPVR